MKMQQLTGGKGRPFSLPFMVMFYFSQNADEELSSGDIAKKFDYPLSCVARVLRPTVEAGMLQTRRAKRGVTGLLIYSPGPVLVEMLEQWKPTRENSSDRSGLRDRAHSESATLPSQAGLVLAQNAELAGAEVLGLGS